MRRIISLSVVRSRIIFLFIALGFAVLVQYVYVDILASHSEFEYMGVRSLPAGKAVKIVFFLLAVVPALWLSVHTRRPTDIAQLFLFYTVHIPTCILLPRVSYSSYLDQVLFAAAILLGLLSLDLRYRVPLLRIPHIQVKPHVFWGFFMVFYAFSFAVIANSGYLSLSNINLIEVYSQRLELSERMKEIGVLFFYIANWTGTATAPFLIIAGLHKRRLLLVVGGIAIAFASFVVSSNKANYMGIPVVIAVYLMFRIMKGRHIAATLGFGFILMTLVLLVVDRPNKLPLATWIIFHRTFTNNGFLSAVYLDLFRQMEPAYYLDSFMRWAPIQGVVSPPAVIAGASFTNVPGVHANANLWADGYANLGYIGIAFSALSALLVFWLFDSISKQKNQAVVAAALIMPAATFANTAVHTALLSNGMIVVFILIWLWSGGDSCTEEISVKTGY